MSGQGRAGEARLRPGRGSRGAGAHWNMESNTGQSCPPTLKRRSFSSNSSSKQLDGLTCCRNAMNLRGGGQRA